MRTFTTKKPTKPGQYFLKLSGRSEPEHVIVENRDGELIIFNSPHSGRNVKTFLDSDLWSPALIALSDMREETEKLLALLNDPQGMMTWMNFVQERLRNLSKMRMLPIDYSS